MEFADKLKEFCTRLKTIKAKIKSEEATKTSIIMPFFSLLGYDVFNPLEFVPEYTADVGIKKGEKVDYAIMDKKQNPIILVEAKCCDEDLGKHGSQLFRYFATTSAKFAILTNGIIYQFYTDLDEQNKMDKKPFLTVNLLSLRDSAIPYLQKFEKSALNVNDITAKANELKYSDQIRDFISSQIDNPADGFVNYVIADIYKGRKTQRVIEDFRPLVKKAFIQLVNDRVSEKVKSTLDSEMLAADKLHSAKNVKVSVETPPPKNDTLPDVEKLESFLIVKSMVHDCLNNHEIKYNVQQGILLEVFLDDDPQKWVCRVDYAENKFYINLPSGDKEYIKRQIRSVEDIYFYRAQLCYAVQNKVGK